MLKTKCRKPILNQKGFLGLLKVIWSAYTRQKQNSIETKISLNIYIHTEDKENEQI